MKLACLDLYCGGGGAARGLHAAGFASTVGVDVEASPRYPGHVIVGDARTPPVDPASFALIWASPPCTAFSHISRLRGKPPPEDTGEIAIVRRWMAATGKPYIIENVPGAPIRPDVVLTGPTVGLHSIQRRRWFELSWWPHAPTRLLPEPLPCRGDVLTITTSMSSPNHFYRRRAKGLPGRIPVREARAAMGIDPDDPMTAREVGLAVAPPMARLLGELAIEHLTRRAA